MEGFPILSLLTWLPVLGMVAILFLKKEQHREIKYTALVVTGLQVVLAIILLSNYDYSLAGINDAESFQFMEEFRWIEITGVSWLGTIKVDYFLGVDGLSVPMVLLTALISFIATLSSWKIPNAPKRIFCSIPFA